MSDTFNIDNVKTLITDATTMEVSDISKIIIKMVDIKNDINRIKQKKTQAYTIDDKIILNCFSNNLQHKIKKCFIDSYNIVEDAIDEIGNLEASIRSDLYDYYWETYIDVLTDLHIDIENEQCIKDHSDKIYNRIIEIISAQIFNNRQSDIETNKKITYLNSITAYVFYECKILIPIETSKRSGTLDKT
ncbi:hypothetical protein [Megasphaera sueciensis]|uniref:hypothetical protein n=1 Tax=Megasphaera sueciensis TaxID=349094 RepID=UPI003D03FBE4